MWSSKHNLGRPVGTLSCRHVSVSIFPREREAGEKLAGSSSQLPKQNYEALLESCLRSQCLFEDDRFPATLSSIGCGPLLQKLPPRLQWKRPPELHSNPQFYSAGAKRLDLCQGYFHRDCWFLAALQALTLHQDILSRVVPLNQSFTEKYAGIFQFWFWQFGNWVPVVIDDRLPVNEAGQLVFVSSTYENLFWGALLEKAYAKLSGSYEDLQFGQVSEALVDFTGGVTVVINLEEAPRNLWDILTHATYNRTLIGCQTHIGERVLENGLVDGHAYTLTGIRKVTCKYGPKYLVKLWNPWGKVEWKGDWSDSSSTWELLCPKEKILLLRKDDDGEFWMTLQDFKAHFVLLVICKLTPGLLNQETGKRWTYTIREGRWVKGSTAGGRLKSSQGTFWKNPQFLLSVWKPESREGSLHPCNVLVSLLQKPRHRHRNWKPHLAIGFYLFRVGQILNDQRRLPPMFFWENTPLKQPVTFKMEKEVSQELWLDPGRYLIVPCTSKAHQELEFIIRVFSRKHIFYEIGSHSSVVFFMEIIDQNEGQDEFFTKLFEKYPEINAVQLQNILNHMTWSNLTSTKPFFSLDACQGILALLDLNASGTVSIQEFRDLWKWLMLCQEVFHKQDSHQLGYLNWNQLRAAVKEAGIVLSDDVCKLMLIRYGSPSLQIDFVNFVHLMLRAENMEDAFQNLTQDGKSIYLQKPEWLMMTLYS
ncbi:calpain-14 [Orycteropus afer afer]|uniref:Calpain-14 n=1 Tax=Orycteropus afer afer TaxID=1230840 RepID=A0A8B6ZN42_ORYAF|nr:calpain-14 [Orycteropus afer afer]